jgi:hypothetical protein
MPVQTIAAFSSPYSVLELIQVATALDPPLADLERVGRPGQYCVSIRYANGLSGGHLDSTTTLKESPKHRPWPVGSSRL